MTNPVTEYEQWLTAGDWTSQRIQAVSIVHAPTTPVKRFCVYPGDTSLSLTPAAQPRNFKMSSIRIDHPEMRDDAQLLRIAFPLSEDDLNGENMYEWVSNISADDRKTPIDIYYYVFITNYSEGPAEDVRRFKVSRVRVDLTDGMVWECEAPNLGNSPMGSVYKVDDFPQLQQMTF